MQVGNLQQAGNAAVVNNFEKAKRNVLRTMMIVCCGFILCWSSNQIIYLLYWFGMPLDSGSWFTQFSVAALQANSCVNPIIYSIYYEEFREAAYRLLQKLHPRKNQIGLVATSTANTSRHVHAVMAQCGSRQVTTVQEHMSHT